MNKKKGLIFSLDASIAVTVVLIMLVNSSYYFTTSNKESTSQLQLIKIGNDIMKFSHTNGTLTHLVLNDSIYEAPKNISFIDPKLTDFDDFLPFNYDFKFIITDMEENPINESTLSISENDIMCPAVGGPPNCCDALECTGIGINLTTESIEKQGRFYIQVNYTHTGENEGHVNVTVNDHAGDVSSPVSATLNVSQLDSPVLADGISPILFVQGENNVSFTTSPNIQIQWFRVIGSLAYAGETPGTVPNDRFIGTGQRTFSVEKNGTFQTVHVARFYTWLK